MNRRTEIDPQLEGEAASFLEAVYERSRGITANRVSIHQVVRDAGLTVETTRIKRILEELTLEGRIVHRMIGHVSLTPEGRARVEGTRKRVRGNSVLISYSRRDKRWMELVAAHLKTVELEVWVDRNIAPGSRWREEIREALATSPIAVLLLSADYLSSEFILNEELPVLLGSWRRSEITLLPIHVRPASLEGFPELGEIQAANDPANPLIKMKLPEREKFLADTATRIRALSLGSGSTPRLSPGPAP